MQIGVVIRSWTLWLLAATVVPAWAAQPTVAKIRQGSPHEALLAVAFDGNSGLAVGVGGALMTTEDGGSTWKTEASPTNLSITAVAIRSHRKLLAGQLGEIFFDDGSGKWQKSESITKERILGIAINASGIGLGVGSFGAFIRSEDGGKSWENLQTNWDPLFAEASDLGSGFQPQLYGVQIGDDGLAIVVGEFETIIKSDDSGKTWHTSMVGNVVSGDRPPTLFAVSAPRDHHVYAVGQSGVIMSSEDSGKTWCRSDSGTDANLFDVASLGNGDVVVSGMRRMIYQSVGTQSWSVIDGQDLNLAWYSGVATNGRGDVIAVGQSGNIIKISH